MDSSSGRYGQRLIVDVLSELAMSSPEDVFASIPNSAELQDGFRDVTCEEIGLAVDTVARFLLDEFSSIKNGETIAYIGTTDLRYNLLFYAAIKLRAKALLPSPRNTLATNASLLQQSACTKIVCSPELAGIANDLGMSVQNATVTQLPSLDQILAGTLVPTPIPYGLQFEQVKDEPILVLHSSGSTGFPKLVTMTHSSFAVMDNDRNIPPVPGRRNHDATTFDTGPGTRTYSPFPSFHLAGLVINMILPVFYRPIPVFNPPTRLPSSSLAMSVLRSQIVSSAFLPPSFVADIFSEPGGLEVLKSLRILCFGGGPLPDAIGDELIKHITLAQFYGSTENFGVRQLMPRKEFWQYIEFHPSVNFELQPAEDDASELVIHAQESNIDAMAFQHNFPGLREYRTKDLFKEHPTQKGLWKFHARRDDILVLSNGHKVNPLPMETAVSALPGVGGALVVGQGQVRVGILIELKDHGGLEQDPLSLWPSISSLNAIMPMYGHISKSLIRLSDPRKPFIRAGKGTVIRRMTERAYEQEIRKMFNGVGVRLSTKQLKPSKFHRSDVTDVLRSIFQGVLDSHLQDDENFMILGMDSIKSLEALNEIKNSLSDYKDLGWISLDTLYKYPSIVQLSEALLNWLNEGVAPSLNRSSILQQTFSRYEAQLPAPGNREPIVFKETINVILVGSTGFLGRQLLEMLADDPGVSNIDCLNRSSSASVELGDNYPNSTAKISFHHVKFREPFFGLPKEICDHLLNTCDAIVHSAWQLNFLMPVTAFEDSLQGLLNSIRLAAAAKRSPRLLYVSSISAAGVSGRRGAPRRTIPEGSLTSLEDAMPVGYAESKIIGEQLISSAVRASGICATILRVAQIVPSLDSVDRWPASDSLRSLLISSKLLRRVPTDVMNVNWVQVDTVGQIIREVMHCDIEQGSENPTFLNVLNPSTTRWQELLPTIVAWCGTDTSTLLLKDWLKLIESQGGMMGEQELPIRFLVHFFRLAAEEGGEEHAFSQEKLLEVSPSARSMAPINDGWLKAWLALL